MLKINQLIVISGLILLTGCVHNQKKSVDTAPKISKITVDDADGPPLHYVDVSAISDAIPKLEPLSRYGNPATYSVFGKQYKVLPSSEGYKQTGIASWYGRKFHGRRTSSGDPYDVYQMTAAHKTLPLPTYASVKNLNNGKEIIVKINDRGPFVGDRLIDLSYAAAIKLGLHNHGTSKVVVTALNPKTIKNQPIQVAKADKTLPAPQTLLMQNPKSFAKIPSEKIFVQLGAFQSKANASILAKKTSHYTKEMKLLDVYVHEAKKTSSKPLYSVRIGPFKNDAEAQAMKVKLAQAALATPLVVRDLM